MASEDTEMVTGPSGEGTSAGASASAGSKRPKRFEIKKWNAVALWAWGMRFLLVSIVLFLGMQSERRNLLVYEKKIGQRERERERERERDFFSQNLCSRRRGIREKDVLPVKCWYSDYWLLNSYLWDS
jgi:hypothetical protein